jgi:hypothetical protein
VQDITLILEDSLESDFNTICEDESTEELGELIVTLWRTCGEGDLTLLNKVLSTESLRATVIQQSRGLEGGDEIDSDNENDGTTLEAVLEGNEKAIEEDMEMEEAPPLVDPDGWQTVTKPKKGKALKKK